MTCQSHSRRNSSSSSLIALPASHRSGGRIARGAARGFTLIEMLVSLAITLIMMGAVVTLFGVISESVSKSRSLIETSDRLRAAREVIQQDLQGATASLTPPLSPENDQGYFEIGEGPSQDGGPIKSAAQSYGVSTAGALFGDCDDYLMLTVRSRSGQFLGKYSDGAAPRVIESPIAEVVYFLVQNGPVIDTSNVDGTGNIVGRLCTLYRRVLLVSPSLPRYTVPFTTFYETNDVSVHHTLTPAEALVPNNLGDLTKRENRFAHYGDMASRYGQFPFVVTTSMLPQVPFAVVPTAPTRALFANPVFPANRPDVGGFLTPLSGSRLGDDVLLTNVIAFDVRVWDPQAIVVENNGIVMKPGDHDYQNTYNQVATGAYVDLGYDPTTVSPLGFVNSNQKTTTLFGTTRDTNYRIYDTWSLHYENDGIDQDGQFGADAGTNGLDDDADGLVDERDLVTPSSSEYDTHPPYAIPLRGIEITLRVYEPSSQQVREVVIVQNFDTKK